MALVSLKAVLTQNRPENSKNPDKTDFLGKSGTLSGTIRPDFSLKNPVCPEILAILVVIPLSYSIFSKHLNIHAGEKFVSALSFLICWYCLQSDWQGFVR